MAFRIHSMKMVLVLARFLGVAFLVGVIVGCEADPSPARPSPVAAALQLSVFPSTLLLSGSTVRITANVVDTQEARHGGAIVRFTTSSGELSATSAVTSSGGEASVTLTASARTTVTATGDGIGSRSIDLPAVAPFRITIEPLNGLPTFTPADEWRGFASVTSAASVVSPPPVAGFETSCGTKMPSSHPGSTQLFFSCGQFPAGVHRITVTGSTASGWTTARNLTVHVIVPATTIDTVEISSAVFRSEDNKTAVSFSVMKWPGQSGAHQYTWDFGDGDIDQTPLSYIDHTYKNGPQERRVSVVVTQRGGATIATGRTAGRW